MRLLARSDPCSSRQEGRALKIGGLRAETTPGGRHRVAATVTWEERDKPAETVYFESPAAFAADMAPRPEAFLLVGVMPAMDFGERRVEI